MPCSWADRGSHLGNLSPAFHRLGQALELVLDGLHGTLDAPLHGHRVGARSHVLEPLADNGLRQDHRRRCAVTGHVVRLTGGLLDELGAHVLEVVLQLDLLGDGHAVTADLGRPELLVQDHVAPSGPQGHLHRVGQGVKPSLQTLTSILVKC